MESRIHFANDYVYDQPPNVNVVVVVARHGGTLMSGQLTGGTDLIEGVHQGARLCRWCVVTV